MSSPYPAALRPLVHVLVKARMDLAWGKRSAEKMREFWPETEEAWRAAITNPHPELDMAFAQARAVVATTHNWQAAIHGDAWLPPDDAYAR